MKKYFPVMFIHYLSTAVMLFNVIFSLATAHLITLEIEENTAVGTRIVDLRTMIFPQPPKTVRLSLTLNPYFLIQDNSVLYIKGIIDRDQDRDLCKNPEFPNICQWSSFVLMDTGKHFDIKIAILDQNDNSPSWETDSIHLQIPENTPGEYQLEFPMGKDPDSGTNGIQRYSIMPLSSVFFISGAINGAASPRLVLSKGIKLDRELKAWYNMTLVAFDGGIPPMSGSISVVIEILDENDNDPMFESSHYQCSIDEDIQPGSTLALNIKAVDSDSGIFGKLNYKLVLSSPQYVREHFKINPKTGQVSTIEYLNYKNRRQFYEFIIVAEDGGVPHRTAETNIKIQIIDKNSHAPKIMMNSMPDPTSKSISILENADDKVAIASFTVEDRDQGVNGQFNCTMIGKDSEDFYLKYSRRLGRLEIYFLETKRSFDREKQFLFVLGISCEDYGSPKLTSIKDVMIEVEDVNDNSPMFEKTEYWIRTTEGNEPYSLIYQITATDLDKGNNSKLRYQIESNKDDVNMSPFLIDSDGKIVAQTMLDREKHPEGFELVIRAFDHGNPPRTASTTIKIELEDVNDCSPEFTKPRYDFQIEEDYADTFRRRFVGQVKADDRDLLENAIVFYRLSQETKVPFEIDSKTGSIFVSRLLDRETSSSQISFPCIAVDNPNNLLFRKTSTAEVVIEITDLNDNKPEFIFPNDTEQEIKLSYHAHMGFIITTVTAKDSDTGVNAKLRYVITDGNSLSLFQLNEVTGIIQLTKDLKPSNKGYEILTIKAIDNGKTQVHMSVSKLRIIIDNFDLLAFSGSTNTLTIPGNDKGLLHFEWWEPNKLIIMCILLATALISCILIGAICVMAKRRNAHVEKDDIKMVDINDGTFCKHRISETSAYDGSLVREKTDFDVTTNKLLCYDLSSNNLYFGGQTCLHPVSQNYVLT